jgi:hypothetical protein
MIVTIGQSSVPAERPFAIPEVIEMATGMVPYTKVAR